MTEPPISYDELLAAHRQAVAQRDRARRIAVALEQELAQFRRETDDLLASSEAKVAWFRREVGPIVARICQEAAENSTRTGQKVPAEVAEVAEVVAYWEARAAFGDEP